MSTTATTTITRASLNGSHSPRSPKLDAIVPTSSKRKTTNSHHHHQQQRAPLDKIQYYLQTPYGRGLTLRTTRHADGKIQMREIELLDWKTTTTTTVQSAKNSLAPPPPRKPAILHSCVDFPSVEPQVGDSVMTAYGKGVVQVIRSETKLYQVQLIHWRLAQRGRVTCYLNSDAVKVIRPAEKLYEMTTVWEKVDYATQKKAQATALFTQKQQRSNEGESTSNNKQEALQLYAAAIEAVKYVQHSPQSDNYVRADLVALLITCSNNAATCALQVLANTTTEQETQKLDGIVTYKQIISYSQNALNLILALESKGPDSKLRAILRRPPHNFSDAKLFGQFVVKSYLLQAKAYWHLREVKACGDACQLALRRIDQFVHDSGKSNGSSNSSSEIHRDAEIRQLSKAQKEVQQWQQKAKEQKRAQLQREKKRAQAMFGADAGKNGSKSSSPTIATTAETASSTAPSKPLGPQNGEATNHEKASGNSNGSSPGKPTSPTRRRVSFSEQLVSERQIEHRHDVEEYQEEVPWYQDVELLIGLSLFGGVAIAATVGAGMLLMGVGSRPSREAR